MREIKLRHKSGLYLTVKLRPIRWLYLTMVCAVSVVWFGPAVLLSLAALSLDAGLRRE